MATKKPERTTLMTNRAMAHALGLFDTTVRSTNSKSIFDTLNKYTANEQQSLLRNIHVTDPVSERISTDARSVFNIFQPNHQKIGAKKLAAKKLRKIAPEISKASSIRVSSIMSPNDLQTGRFIFSIENMEGLEDEIKADICQKLDIFFNDVLDLGKKVEEWCDRALYGVGSVPIFIYPSTALLALKETGLVSKIGSAENTPTVFKNESEPSGGKKIAGTEALKQKYYSLKQELETYYSDKTFEYLFNTSPRLNRVISNESLKIESNLPSTFDNDVIGEIIDRCNLSREVVVNQLSAGIESTKVTLTKEIEEGDVIRLTENPEIIKFANEYKRYKKQKIDNTYSDFLKGKEGSILQSAEYKPEELISFLKYSENNLDETGHPFWMVLPSESVIPLINPGDPKNTSGYLILIDEYGHPLEYDESMDINSTGCCGGKIDAAYQAMFQRSCGSFNKSGLNNHSKAITSILFSHLIDGYFKAKLKGLGIDNLDINKSNSIGSIMLGRLLMRKRTNVVYVPPMLMTYFCFDYNEDGTGKSLLEDIEFLLSLKATFLVASIMAMANDSINHHNINLTFDDKTTNYEQLMDQVINAYVDKKKMNLSTNPEDISATIARRSVTISPKNMSGIQGFEVTSETTPGNSVQPNNDLLDKIDSMLTSQFGVPHAAMNTLDNDEYSRSVLTSNLFFSKQNARDQTTVCGHMGKFTKSFISYSKILKSEILKVLVNAGNVNTGVNTSTLSSALVETDTKDDYGKILGLIISNIKVSLPSTGAAPDKAIMNELRDYIENIRTLADIIFNDDTIPSDDNQARDMLRIIRAQWLRQFGISFFNKLGVSNAITIPSLEDIALEQTEYSEYLQGLNNLITRLKQQRKVFTPNQDGDSFGSSTGGDDTFGFGDSDEFGSMDSLGSDDTSGSEEPFAEDNKIDNPADFNTSNEDTEFNF